MNITPLNSVATRIKGLAVIAIITAASAHAQLVNPGFETGLTGWTVVNQAGASGGWFSQTGTGSPLNGFGVPAPVEGTFAAMTDQGGPGSHVLFQDFVVPVGVAAANLSFNYSILNQAGTFSSPASLDFTVVPNQQFRADIITTGADPFSVAGVDVLANLYQTNPGDPASSGYNLVTTDLTSLFQAHEGETLRLRFAETDNQLFFAAGVDNVQLTTRIGAVPEPSTYGLFGAAALAGLITWKRSRRKTQVL